MEKLYTDKELDNMDYYIRIHGNAIIKNSARKAWKKSIRLLIKQARLANKLQDDDDDKILLHAPLPRAPLDGQKIEAAFEIVGKGNRCE